MNVETITSRQNPLMTHLRKLASSRSYRKKSGEYLVFGISKKPIWLTEKEVRGLMLEAYQLRY